MFTGFGLAAQVTILLNLIEQDMVAQDDMSTARQDLAFDQVEHVRQGLQRRQGQILADAFMWAWRVERALEGRCLWIG